MHKKMGPQSSIDGQDKVGGKKSLYEAKKEA